jgi:HlyD family secretion protein
VFVVRGTRLVRQPVTFGIASIDFFEVTSGLMPGDEVVISEMRDYARLERVRLE